MTRYYFHIKDGAELIHDPEGSELATMEDARSQALKSARMQLSSPMNMVTSPLCRWPKRYPGGQGSWFEQGGDVCPTYR